MLAAREKYLARASAGRPASSTCRDHRRSAVREGYLELDCGTLRNSWC